ncbi:hypothetical protein P7G87_06845 [Enterococcus asini]|uniref:YczE/YyaS/YitT family protein n=1 Tax=Enterococcus asini TaxID=57732 RepID=UPI001E46A102|nr:hypothetical protein [Enterococcus asini]MCD5029394.1 hypothetical protein [Enterococcus asini]MDT2763547.1 hypothetical protein [Enterococcus asini]MDT2784388.1 hypothetical protein [Enterococcus asini]
MNSTTISRSLFFYLLSAFGISLTLKASIGVSSFNSFNATLAAFSQLKVGTITTGVNLLFLGACLFLDPHPRWQNYLMMAGALFFFGSTINLCYYFLLPSFAVPSYVGNVLLFITGTVIAGIGTGKVLKYQLLKFPIETFCVFLAERTKYSFAFYRQSIDFVCIGLALALSFLGHLPLMVREGTLISFLLLSRVIARAKE